MDSRADHIRNSQECQVIQKWNLCNSTDMFKIQDQPGISLYELKAFNRRLNKTKRELETKVKQFELGHDTMKKERIHTSQEIKKLKKEKQNTEEQMAKLTGDLKELLEKQTSILEVCTIPGEHLPKYNAFFQQMTKMEVSHKSLRKSISIHKKKLKSHSPVVSVESDF